MKARGTFQIQSFENPNETTSYRVTGTKLNGERVRENYKNQTEALARKQELEVEGQNFIPDKRITTTRLTLEQEAEAEQAFAEIKASPLLKNVPTPLLKALRYFAANYREPLKPITVREAYNQFIEAKKKEGLREASTKALKSRVGFLASLFGDKLVSDILPAHVSAAISKPGITTETKEDNRRSMSSFFSWCMDNEYCPTNPAKKTKRGRIAKDDSEPAVLTMGEVRKLLQIAQAYKGGKLIPYLALSLFAGIRPDREMARLTWDNIDLSAGTITIGPKIAKMRQRRIVEFATIASKDQHGKDQALPANLIEWLAPHALNKTPIKGPNWRKDFDAIKRMAGYGDPERKPKGPEAEEQKAKRLALKPWQPDVLRHTAISNHLALYQHEGKTATWAGNSPDIIQRHYKGLVKQADAREFWAITPEAISGKIITLPKSVTA